LPLEIFSHGVIVANEDVASNGFIPGKRLRRWQCFESLVGSSLGILAVIIVVGAAVVTVVFLVRVVVFLGRFGEVKKVIFKLALVPLGIDIEVNVGVKIGKGRFGVNPLVEASIETHPRIQTNTQNVVVVVVVVSHGKKRSIEVIVVIRSMFL